MIKLDTDADYYNDMQGLAKILLEEVKSYRMERETYDINDSFYDYLGGLISARQTVLGRIGVPMELYYIEDQDD